MYIYDLVAMVLIGLCHVMLYLYFIRYDRLSYPLIFLISIVFTVLLATIVTVTGYPEFNTIMMGLFLLSLGLMQIELTFLQNLYFTIANMVSISLFKIVLVELGLLIYLWTPFNLYIWTVNLIHMIVTIFIFIFIVLLRKQIQKFAQYIVTSPLYYVSYAVFSVSLVVIFLLTMPGNHFLHSIYNEYREEMYIGVFILFFILLLIVIIGSHLTKEKLLRDQQDYLDNELLDYVRKLEVLHDELANFRHDYINLLLTLDEGVRSKNMKEIERIYYKVIAPTSEIINNREIDIVKLANVGQTEIKSLLSVKVMAAQQQDIDIMIDIPHLIRAVPISVLKFIRMISILVDNGIEAALTSKEKIVQIAFFENANGLYFVVQNSVVDGTINLKGIFEKNHSTKDAQRGYGLYSLKRMVDQSPEVTLETSYQAPFFKQTLIIRK